MDVALRRSRAIHETSYHEVSILVFMDVALRLRLFRAHTAEDWFQSLFSWMLLWDNHRVLHGYRRLPVSILVFMDVALRLLTLWSTLWNTCVSILVFMDVALRLQVRVPEPFTLPGVSILVFMDVALRHRTMEAPDRDAIWFQSLFSWMLLWDGDSVIQLLINSEFQSLFSWMLLWDRQPGYRISGK